MKTLEHVPWSTDICIQKFINNTLIGHFFKEKPEVGDEIKSVAMKLNAVVKEIKLNRNSRISATSAKDPTNSYFELVVEPII